MYFLLSIDSNWCTIPPGIVLQDLGRIVVERTGSKCLEEKQLLLF